jgi:uncharacterized membrane protein
MPLGKGGGMKRFAVGNAFSLRGREFQGLSGFDGKPFHPPLTDIPVGAYVIAPVLDVLAFIGRNRSWGRDMYIAASYTLLAGAIASLPTALTGFADWLRMRAGSEVRRIANSHAVTMVVVTVLVITNLAVRYYDDVEETTPGILALSIAVLVLVTIGGMIGGSLVYDKGYKVRKRRVEDEPVDKDVPQHRAG